MKIVHLGKEYDVPEGTSMEQLNEFFGISSPKSSDISSMIPGQKEFAEATGINNTPFQDLRNVAAGAVHGALALPRAMDLNNMVPESFKNALLYKNNEAPIHKFNEFNALGTKEQPFMSRGGSEQALGEFGGLINPLSRIAPEISIGMSKAIPFAKQLLEGIRPGKESSNFLKKISGEVENKVPGIEPHPFRNYSPIPQTSSRVTAEQNTANIAKDVARSREEQLQEALSHKKKVFDEEGKENIYQNPASEVAEGNLDKVARIFTNKKEDITPENIDALHSALLKYRKDENLDRFLGRTEDIFEHDPLNESKISKLEDLLAAPTHREGEYSKFHEFAESQPSLRKLHDKFVMKPSLNNYDKLQQQMNTDLRFYEKQLKNEKLEPKDQPTYKTLINAKSALENDVTHQLERKNPALAAELKTFKNKYKENVRPYSSSSILRDISKGKSSGITDSDIRGIFANPDKDVQKVLIDLPRETKNKIIYNELHGIKPTDHEALLEKLDQLEQSKGYKEYFTPEINAFRRSLTKKSKRLNALKGIGAGSAVAVTGHPVLGVMAGLGVMKGKSAVNALIKAIKK